MRTCEEETVVSMPLPPPIHQEEKSPNIPNTQKSTHTLRTPVLILR